jgi:rhodanese-related sulfurtransferase
MRDISPEKVKEAVDKKAEVIVLDVRTPGEYAKGKIPGAINVPVTEVAEKIEQVIPDKNATIYVYCLSATRSPIAVEAMEGLGYKNVFNMSTGLLAWWVYKYPMG